MVTGIYSDDPAEQLKFTTHFRKLLSIEHNSPIEEVVQSGVVPRLVEFLGRDDYPQLQFEAAWALTNIASGTSENTRTVINHGALPLFVKLLGSLSDDVLEQALGNTAGDSPKWRDYVLSLGALPPLLALFNENDKLPVLRKSTWTLSNFCRSKPRPSCEQTSDTLPVLKRLINSVDDEILKDACSALSYLSDGSDEKIQLVIDAMVVPRLVELLLHPSPSVIIPALQTVGNIVTGDEIKTQYLIDQPQSLPNLLSLLTQNHSKSIKKEACWIISNITAGNRDQIEAVISAGIIGPLVKLLQDGEFEIQKKAARAISNATRGGSHGQIKFLVEQGCMKPLCDLLKVPNPRIVAVCLEGLKNILKVGEAEKNLGSTRGVNVFANAIVACEGIDTIENLQMHGNKGIRAKVRELLETYWDEYDEDEEAFPSADASQNEFPLGGDRCSIR
ncbi:importin subunit alpha-1-like [Silene latifolia]|uniref:importin subunit alpha-1-like n=1 Tax=Silene latifolia TaxID=37657 RepID=UPI003D788219